MAIRPLLSGGGGGETHSSFTVHFSGRPFHVATQDTVNPLWIVVEVDEKEEEEALGGGEI